MQFFPPRFIKMKSDFPFIYQDTIFESKIVFPLADDWQVRTLSGKSCAYSYNWPKSARV